MKLSFKKIKTSLISGTLLLGLSFMGVACSAAPISQSAPQPTITPQDVTAPAVVSNLPADKSDLKIFRLGGTIKVTVTWSEALSSNINSQNIQVSRIIAAPNRPANNINGAVAVLPAQPLGDAVFEPVNNATYTIDPTNPSILVIGVPYDSGEDPELAITVGPGAVTDPSGNANTDTIQFDFTTSFKADTMTTAI